MKNNEYDLALNISNIFNLFLFIFLVFFYLIYGDSFTIKKSKFLDNYDGIYQIEFLLIYFLIFILCYSFSFKFFSNKFKKKVYEIDWINLNNIQKIILLFFITTCKLFILINQESSLLNARPNIGNFQIYLLVFKISFFYLAIDLMINKKYIHVLILLLYIFLLSIYPHFSRILVIQFGLAFILIVYFFSLEGKNISFKKFFINIIKIISLCLFIIYIITLLRNFDRSLDFEYNLNFLTTILNIFLRFDFIYNFQKVYSNIIDYIYFNDFRYLIAQVLPNIIDSNNLEYRDYNRHLLDTIIDGALISHQNYQVVTSVNSIQPIIDSFYRFGPYGAIIYPFLYAFIINILIFIYKTDKSKFIYIYSFIFLIIFEKSIYAIIDYHIYNVIIFLIVILINKLNYVFKK